MTKKIISAILLIAILTLSAVGITALIHQCAAVSNTEIATTSQTSDAAAPNAEMRTVTVTPDDLRVLTTLSANQSILANDISAYAGKPVTLTLHTLLIDTAATSYLDTAKLMLKNKGTEEISITIPKPTAKGTVTVQLTPDQTADLVSLINIYWEKNSDVVKVTGIDVSAEFDVLTPAPTAESSAWANINDAYMQYGAVPGYVFYGLTILAVILVLIIIIKIIKEV